MWCVIVFGLFNLCASHRDATAGGVPLNVEIGAAANRAFFHYAD
jgi:hypothetical protein